MGSSLSFVVTGSSSVPIEENATLSIFILSGAGLSRYDIALHINVAGVLLRWMAFDNFNEYVDGPLPEGSISDSWGWLTAGDTSVGRIIFPLDDFDEYSDGPLDTPNLGQGWTENGTTAIY